MSNEYNLNTEKTDKRLEDSRLLFNDETFDCLLEFSDEPRQKAVVSEVCHRGRNSELAGMQLAESTNFVKAVVAVGKKESS